MSYLDDFYAAVARNIGGDGNKRFFHQGCVRIVRVVSPVTRRFTVPRG